VFGEDGKGEVAGLGGGVGGAALGEIVRRGEEGADGGLVAPGDELGEFEVVPCGDLDEGLVGEEEVVEEGAGVDGEVVDRVVDGRGGRSGEHEATVQGLAGKAMGGRRRE
jgi:hypothetical protein